MQISGMNSGLAGVQSGMTRLDNAAEKIAKGDSDSLSPETLIEPMIAENQVNASAKVIATADEMLGTLIDIKV